MKTEACKGINLLGLRLTLTVSPALSLSQTLTLTLTIPRVLTRTLTLSITQVIKSKNKLRGVCKASRRTCPISV